MYTSTHLNVTMTYLTSEISESCIPNQDAPSIGIIAIANNVH